MIRLLMLYFLLKHFTKAIFGPAHLRAWHYEAVRYWAREWHA